MHQLPSSLSCINTLYTSSKISSQRLCKKLILSFNKRLIHYYIIKICVIVYTLLCMCFMFSPVYSWFWHLILVKSESTSGTTSVSLRHTCFSHSVLLFLLIARRSTLLGNSVYHKKPAYCLLFTVYSRLKFHVVRVCYMHLTK